MPDEPLSSSQDQGQGTSVPNGGPQPGGRRRAPTVLRRSISSRRNGMLMRLSESQRVEEELVSSENPPQNSVLLSQSQDDPDYESWMDEDHGDDPDDIYEEQSQRLNTDLMRAHNERLAQEQREREEREHQNPASQPQPSTIERSSSSLLDIINRVTSSSSIQRQIDQVNGSDSEYGSDESERSGFSDDEGDEVGQGVVSGEDNGVIQETEAVDYAQQLEMDRQRQLEEESNRYTDDVMRVSVADRIRLARQSGSVADLVSALQPQISDEEVVLDGGANGNGGDAIDRRGAQAVDPLISPDSPRVEAPVFQHALSPPQDIADDGDNSPFLDMDDSQIRRELQGGTQDSLEDDNPVVVDGGVDVSEEDNGDGSVEEEQPFINYLAGATESQIDLFRSIPLPVPPVAAPEAVISVEPVIPVQQVQNTQNGVAVDVVAPQELPQPDEEQMLSSNYPMVAQSVPIYPISSSARNGYQQQAVFSSNPLVSESAPTYSIHPNKEGAQQKYAITPHSQGQSKHQEGEKKGKISNQTKVEAGATVSVLGIGTIITVALFLMNPLAGAISAAVVLSITGGGAAKTAHTYQHDQKKYKTGKEQEQQLQSSSSISIEPGSLEQNYVPNVPSTYHRDRLQAQQNQALAVSVPS